MSDNVVVSVCVFVCGLFSICIFVWHFQQILLFLFEIHGYFSLSLHNRSRVRVPTAQTCHPTASGVQIPCWWLARGTGRQQALLWLQHRGEIPKEHDKCDQGARTSRKEKRWWKSAARWDFFSPSQPHMNFTMSRFTYRVFTTSYK